MSLPWVAIQRNPMSGSGRRKREMLHLVHRLEELGLRPRLFSNRDRLHARLQNHDHLESLRCIVAAGGDGTVCDVINRFPGLPMTILPLGTENLVARYFSIPWSGTAVAEMIAANHHTRMDLGLANGRRFALMASVGFDASVVQETSRRRRGHIRKWNYLQPLLYCWRTYRYPALRLFLDGEETPHTGAQVYLMNLPMYAMKLEIAPQACPTDGVLDARILKHGSRLHTVRYLWHLWKGGLERLADVASHPVRQVRIESEYPVCVQLDGDAGVLTPVTIEVLPAALDIIVPAKHNGAGSPSGS